MVLLTADCKGLLEPQETPNGLRAAHKIFAKAPPPEVNTLPVFAPFETSTAIVASPITAIRTVTIDVMTALSFIGLVALGLHL
jgi:hypothetical protein